MNKILFIVGNDYTIVERHEGSTVTTLNEWIGSTESKFRNVMKREPDAIQNETMVSDRQMKTLIWNI